MDKFINRLPTDIILYIIPYTYNIQKKELLEDIDNYNYSKNLLHILSNKLCDIISELAEEEADNWLINIMFLYANNYEGTMYGYKEKFYETFRKNAFLKSNEQIHQYVSNLEKKPIESQINLLLGLFTVEQRKDIVVDFYSDINNIQNLTPEPNPII